MLAEFSASDSVTIASAKLNEYLGQEVETIAKDTIPPVFQGIRTALQDVASKVAQSFEQAAAAMIESAMQVGQMLLQMKNDLNRKEYQIFLSQPGWTLAKANKYIKLAKTFEGFELSQLVKVELTTLFALCAKTYNGVVEHLQKTQNITQELVERLMKESRPPRKPRQQSEPITGWKADPKDGGRHYAIKLYDEDTGCKIEQIAAQYQVLPQRVIIDAIATYNPDSEQTPVRLEDYFKAQEELKTVVADVRRLETENRQLKLDLDKRDWRISELEEQLARSTQDKTTVLPPTLSSAPTAVHETDSVVPPPKVFAAQLLRCQTWQAVVEATDAVAIAVGKNRAVVFSSTVKHLSLSARQHLVELLAAYMREFPCDISAHSWLPKSVWQLKEKASAQATRKISG